MSFEGQNRENINPVSTDSGRSLEPLKSPPIELMGELANPRIQYLINQVGHSFGVPTEQLMALIQRESGGNPLARSRSGSRGFMQLTGSLFADMYRIPETGGDGKIRYRGRGIAEYLDNFKEISSTLLESLRPNYPDFVQTLEAIQGLDPKDQQKFSLYTRQLQTQVYTSTALGQIEPNLLIGALYLSSIDDRSKRFLESPKNFPEIRGLISRLRTVNLDSINSMLTAKKFSPVTSKAKLQGVVDAIINDQSKFQRFMTNYNYNGDKTKDPDGNEHRLNYGLAVCISEEQLKTRNRITA